MKLNYIKLNKDKVTEEMFSQILEVEQSSGDECYSKEALKRIYIEDEKDVSFVCFDNNKIVAHIAINPQSKRRNGSIYIINLVVAPEYRRKGIAQKLVDTACNYFIEKGYNAPLSLNVDKDNIPAINLYQKLGFEIVQPICEADNGINQYIMVADLNSVKTKLNFKNKELLQ